MQRIAIGVLLILSLFISSNVFAATGDLQVTCEANIRIFIDNNFKGVTNESDDGLFIEGLAPGRHTLKAIKKGFDPFVKDISITVNKAIEVKISFGQRRERVKSLQPEEGQTLSQVGKMELRSVPLGARVTIDGKAYQQKTDLEIENIPIGRHRIIFERGKQKLSGLFNLEENDVLKLKAHFKEGRIIDLSQLEREEAERARIAEERENEIRREREEKARIEAEKKRARQEYIDKFKHVKIEVGEWNSFYGVSSLSGSFCQWKDTQDNKSITNCESNKTGQGKGDTRVGLRGFWDTKFTCVEGPCIGEVSISFDYNDGTGARHFIIERKTTTPHGAFVSNSENHSTTYYKYCFDDRCVHTQRYDEKIDHGNYQIFMSTINKQVYLNIKRMDLLRYSN